MSLFSKIKDTAKKIASGLSKVSSGGSSSKSSSSGKPSSNSRPSSNAPSAGIYSGNIAQNMNNYLNSGGSTSDAAYQKMLSDRRDKILATDWAAKINASKSEAEKKWLTDVRNEKLAIKAGKGDDYTSQVIGGQIYQAPQPRYDEPIEPDYQEQLDKLAEAREKSAISALTTARNNALAGLKERQASIEPYYYRKRNQAAARSDVGAMNFAQYMGARGVSGNAAAMPEIYRNASLQNDLGALDRQQAADMAGIGRDRSNIETNYQSDVAGASAEAEAQRMQNYIEQMNAERAYKAQQDAIRKEEFTNTIGAYSDDYAAEINRLKSQGYSDDSYEIRALTAARKNKLAEQQAAAEAARQQDFENALKKAKSDYETSKPYYKPSTSKPISYSANQSNVIKLLEAGLIDEAEAKRRLGM
ncbi:hypothetical protein [Anaerovorax sp. IOR16]|uniref:hypothetical protein n=1 Tax=Anaerovorax sp. IOR16 TaxID=2773458 RepID=UPI0019D0656F|nr:hypothetical protein [Anaerovorax sp. IOR16]